MRLWPLLGHGQINQSQSFIISITRTKGRSCLIYIYIMRETDNSIWFLPTRNSHWRAEIRMQLSFTNKITDVIGNFNSFSQNLFSRTLKSYKKTF